MESQSQVGEDTPLMSNRRSKLASSSFGRTAIELSRFPTPLEASIGPVTHVGKALFVTMIVILAMVLVIRSNTSTQQLRKAGSLPTEFTWESTIHPSNLWGRKKPSHCEKMPSSSLNDYLFQRKERPSRKIVIGNEAGDADSVISAIVLAYLEHKTPIVSIPWDDLQLQRPEIMMLFDMAGLSAPMDRLWCVDQLSEANNMESRVTLVDHNVLASRFKPYHWNVTSIMDHHEDAGLYPNAHRTIAFAKGQALVASACTLVAEKMFHMWCGPYPASLSVLLMGVILLDSVNLSEAAGKVTARDFAAVDRLLHGSDWTQSSKRLQKTLHIKPGETPDPSRLFKALQGAKYDPAFWASLSVKDALRQDYKDFDTETGFTFGISTVLMPLDSFLLKAYVIDGIFEFMQDHGVHFLGVMLAFEIDDILFRQLILCGDDTIDLQDIASYLEVDQVGTLGLVEVNRILFDHDYQLHIRFFNQEMVQASRKQIGPILQDFFER